MTSKTIVAAVVILLAAPALHAAETANPAQTGLAVPQSLRVEHAQLVEVLTELAQQHDNIANAATQTLTILKPHLAKEEEYVFPPLGLLPALSEGRVTPDMQGAVAMAEKVKAERGNLFQEHTRITEALNNLVEVAGREHQTALVAFARSAAVHSLDEIEVLQPAAILVGEYVKTKLAGGQPAQGTSEPKGATGATQR